MTSSCEYAGLCQRRDKSHRYPYCGMFPSRYSWFLMLSKCAPALSWTAASVFIPLSSWEGGTTITPEARSCVLQPVVLTKPLFPTAPLVLSHWQPEINQAGCVDTKEIGKCYKSGRSAPTPFLRGSLPAHHYISLTNSHQCVKKLLLVICCLQVESNCLRIKDLGVRERVSNTL